jgi:hypothetical protein
LRSWCNDDWGYACLHVTLLDADGDELDDYDDYLGGVEDGYTIRNGKMYALGGHANECALVLADKILDSYKKDQDTELTAALHSVKDDAMYQSGII